LALKRTFSHIYCQLLGQFGIVLDLAKFNNKNYNPKNQLFTVLQFFSDPWLATPTMHRGLNANTTTVSKADKYNCANQTRRREHDQLGRPPVPCFWKTQTLSPAMRADASACYQ
jgi:hypothetical protein